MDDSRLPVLVDAPATRAARDGNGSRPPLLALEGIVVRRGGRAVLDGLTLGVGRSEILGLLGRNGAGKTTAFQVLAGLLEPDDGRLAFEGRQVRFGARSLRERIGVVFQDPALDPRLTCRENLAFAGRLHGVPRRSLRERVEQRLQDAGLSDRADEAVSRLSGGMRRRLDLARAMLHDPALLILDEPTTGLDETAFRRAWDQLERLRREGEVSILLTTHRPEEAERCDRLGILEGGRLVACDSPEALRERVRGDLLVLETADPSAVAETLSARFGVEPRILDGKVVIERERVHEFVPRVVEAFPEGTLRSVSVRRTGLGEVFLELTGHDLDRAVEAGARAMKDGGA